MRESKLFKPLLAFLALVMICASAFTQSRLNGDRSKLGLTRNEPLKNAPPILAFTTVALGGFRGLIANVLWIRANDLQQDEKYFEMVQLADWITKLQPQFTSVWIHQAWNMAYNISIKFPNKEDRWHWVYAGIKLLRDEALRFNPHEPLIYREIGWFYENKIGQNVDDQHEFFKLTWAYEMSQVIGDPPYDFKYLVNPQTDEAKQRATLLLEKYKLDPKIMVDVEERYGPLDWRMPETHAIYWATAGLKYAKQDDLMPLRRLVYQSMQLAFQRGRLVVNKADSRAEFAPNVDIIPKVNNSYEEMIAAEPNVENIKQGHMNFLLYAVATLYLYNRESDAAKWWHILETKYPPKLRGFNTMDDFVMWRVGDLVENDGQDKYNAAIRGYLSRSFYYLALGEEERAVGYQNWARKAWKVHDEKIFVKNKPEIYEKLKLPPFEQMKREELDKLINPKDSNSPALSPQLALQLRTRLGLPPPTNMVAQVAKPVVPLRPSTSSDLEVMPVAERNLKAGEAFLAKNRDAEGVSVLASGVQYKILSQGSGPKPKPTDGVSVHYRGTLIDGQEFDNSYKRGEPFRFMVSGGVIKGWTDALPLMPVGSKWRLFIPPHMAYGESGRGGLIGPNATLIFDVELLRILKPEEVGEKK